MSATHIVGALKATIVAAWILSIVALTMVANLTDNYRHGYEDMLKDASLMFYAGGVLSILAAIGTFLMRRNNPQGIAKGWLIGACCHSAGTAIVLGSLVFMLFSGWWS